MKFHTHIYFEPNDLSAAQLLSERAAQTKLFEYVRLHKLPIGPHPTGMIECHFDTTSYDLVLDWLEAHRGSFSVLIHEDTGDDYQDHTTGARWLGEKLPLDFSFFELIRSNPKKRIHN